MKSKVYVSEAEKKFLKKYLPFKYWEDVAANLGISQSEENYLNIKRVRWGVKKDYEVLKVIIDLAKEQQKAKQEINEVINAE